MHIVAIGGGDMRVGETLPIDRRIVELTGKENPKAVFLPTASFDDVEYIDAFRAIYGEKLGCEVQPILLWTGYDRDEIERKIQATKWNTHPARWDYRGDPEEVRQLTEDADLFYVGGGNTRRLLEMWRSAGLDRMLKSAAERGAVLSGLSAGCICWARYGNSDAALSEDLGRDTMRVDGLDLLPMALCPHMSREGFRLAEFQSMMRETPGVGLGLDDGCAFEVDGQRYRLLSCVPGASAHRVTAGSYSTLEPFEDFRDLADLLGPQSG